MHDFDRFTSVWFQLKSTVEIKRENFEDWLLWALFSTDRQGSIDITDPDPTTCEELNEYMEDIERVAGRKLEPGRNSSIHPMRLTLDPVVILPRPLVWYAVSAMRIAEVIDQFYHKIVATVDLITYITLYSRGFTHYSLSPWIGVFPPRPQTILSRRSLATMPYWYRPHRSRDKLPVIMLHGVGVGDRIISTSLHLRFRFMADWFMALPSVS